MVALSEVASDVPAVATSAQPAGWGTSRPHVDELLHFLNFFCYSVVVSASQVMRAAEPMPGMG